MAVTMRRWPMVFGCVVVAKASSAIGKCTKLRTLGKPQETMSRENTAAVIANRAKPYGTRSAQRIPVVSTGLPRESVGELITVAYTSTENNASIEHLVPKANRKGCPSIAELSIADLGPIAIPRPRIRPQSLVGQDLTPGAPREGKCGNHALPSCEGSAEFSRHRINPSETGVT